MISLVISRTHRCTKLAPLGPRFSEETRLDGTRRTTGGAAGGRGPGVGVGIDVGVGGFGGEIWKPGSNVKGDCVLKAGSPEADRHRWKGYIWMSNVVLRTWF